MEGVPYPSTLSSSSPFSLFLKTKGLKHQRLSLSDLKDLGELGTVSLYVSQVLRDFQAAALWTNLPGSTALTYSAKNA